MRLARLGACGRLRWLLMGDRENAESVAAFMRGPKPACPECGYDLRGAPEPICPECGLRITAADLMPLDERSSGAWEAGILGLAVVVPLICLVPAGRAGGPVGVWTPAGLALLSEPIVWCACLVYWIRQRRRVVMADSGQAYVWAFAVTCVSIVPIVLSMVL